MQRHTTVLEKLGTFDIIIGAIYMGVLGIEIWGFVSAWLVGSICFY